MTHVRDHPKAPKTPHWIAGALCALAACSGSTESPEPVAPAAPRPDVIVIVMETTRADRCSLLGYDRPTTPFLEALARESTVFTRTFAPAPWTAPSHGSLFTGLRPDHHGLVGDASMYLSERYETLAETLRKAGYATAGFSTNPFVSRDFGLTQGFDTFQEVFDEPDLPYPHAPLVHERALETAATARANGTPFFLFLNHMEPHLPYTPPDDFQARFLRDGVSPGALAAGRAFRYPGPLAHNLGVDQLDEAEFSVLSDLYDAEIATLDREIGTFVERLRVAGLLDETLLVITSDHGENLGEHGLVDHMFSVHHTLLHVPLLLRLPDRFDAGKRVDDIVRLEDLFPTILDVCGVPLPDGLDGETLTGPVSGRIATGRLGRPTALLERAAETFPEADTSALAHTLWSVHSDRYQFLRSEAGWTRLFDVVADPLETNDLSTTRPDVAERLRKLLPASAR